MYNSGNKNSLVTQNFLVQNKEIRESNSSFSENLFNKKYYQKMNSRILENLKGSLKYLKNLQKKEFLNFKNLHFFFIFQLKFEIFLMIL